MASQNRFETLARLFLVHFGRIMLSVMITLGLLGISAPQVQAAGETITGRVTRSADNQPVSGVVVYADEFDTNTRTAEATTASDGSYTLFVNPGIYRVRACPGCSGSSLNLANVFAGGTQIYDQAQPIQVETDQQYSLDFSLDPGGLISGVISDSGNQPISGMTVAILNADNQWVDAASTEADGSYLLSGIPYGDFKVLACADCNGPSLYPNIYYAGAYTFETATSIMVAAGSNPSSIDISLPLGNTIQGKVTDNNIPGVAIEGVTIGAIRWDETTSQWTWYKSVETTTDGSYNISGLPDGSYHVQACPECTGKVYVGEYYNDKLYLEESQEISLQNGSSQSGINFGLASAAIIAGHVNASDGMTALSNIPIFVENTQNGHGFSSSSDENGNYSINVEPGYYRLRTMVEWNSDLASSNYVDQIYDHALNLEEAPLIQAVLNEPKTGYDFTLHQGGILTGTITDVSHAPLENATVMAIAADGSRRSYGSQPTGADGVYTLRGLPAGQYVIRAMHEGSQSLYYGGSANWNKDHSVTITAGETTENINFQLAAQGSEDSDLLTMRQSATIADMYDPGWVEYVHNAYLVDQIFAGMARINPANGSTLSNLSNSWQSSDNIHWTFTLRSGLTWSDGSPLTAADMRFALLRNLKMNGVVDNMMIIQGAEAYNQGTASANQVGIMLDSGDADHIIHFTLTQKVAFFPTLMSTMAARPLPQVLIQAFPDSWLSLDKLITSGPYRLIELDSEHVLLQKNLNFIDANNVQIEQVVMKSGSQTETAWSQYWHGELDTAVISPSNIADANQDPVTKDQLNMVSQQCTYFIGFNSNQIEATFGLAGDNAALLRRALIEAIDRDAFNAQTGSGVITAWTFIAPGVLGHSDESSEIYPAYAPAQALTDIQAAFGGNYTGLPAAMLYYPNDVPSASTQRAQMEFLANAWNQVLNAHFTVTGISQDQYEAMLLSRQMLAVRRGWCSDYNDGYNFLSSMYSMDAIFDGWQNANYDQLLSEAASSSSETERAQIYQNAEEILLKTDAILMPLYYNVSPILSRGFVRSFGVGGVDYIGDWTLERTDTMDLETPAVDSLSASSDLEFTPEGENGLVSYSIPGDAFSGEITVIHTGHLTYNLANLPEGKQKTSLYFTFQAEDAAHTQVLPAADYTLTAHYSDAALEASHFLENSLAFYYWDETASQWKKDINSHVDPATNTITTHSRYEGEWLVLGSTETSWLFIPFVMK